jgi:hypothetical protein
MERVRTGAVVDVPKGTVVVGDRRRAPGRSMGANGGGFARRRFHSETVAGVVSETVAGDPDDHPVPLRRTLLHVHDLGQSKSTLRQAGLNVLIGAVAAIYCLPAGTAPQSSPTSGGRAAGAVPADGPMAQVPP